MIVSNLCDVTTYVCCRVAERVQRRRVVGARHAQEQGAGRGVQVAVGAGVAGGPDPVHRGRAQRARAQPAPARAARLRARALPALPALRRARLPEQRVSLVHQIQMNKNGLK